MRKRWFRFVSDVIEYVKGLGRQASLEASQQASQQASAHARQPASQPSLMSTASMRRRRVWL